MKRKLVTIRHINDLERIDGADMIESAIIDGWNVVVKKGEFEVGDPCLFFEIDSFLPADDPRFEFLKKGGTKKDEAGEERIRLKTVKLRKTLSQGLALPLSSFPEFDGNEVDTDLSDNIGVIKYERPEPQVANAAGNFPEYLQRTDEERIQNLWGEWKDKYRDVLFIPTLKLDGSSCTVAYLDNSVQEYWPEEKEGEEQKSVHIGIHRLILCSRNLMLKHDPNSHFWKAYYNSELEDKMADMWRSLGRPFAISGEVCGPGIQGNKEKFLDYKFYAFNLFDIKQQEYVSFEKSLELFQEFDIPHVPLLGERMRPFVEFDGVNDILAFSEGESINAKIREGIVWKSIGLDTPLSFKSISNKFLMKSEE